MPISSKVLVKKKGKILLVFQAIQEDQIFSIREAARVHDVPQITLHARLAGRDFIEVKVHTRPKSSKYEDESLFKQTFSLDKQDASPRPSQVRIIASIIFSNRDHSTSEEVGIKWASSFC